MMQFEDLQCIDYKKAWDYQQSLFDSIIEKKTNKVEHDSHFLLCEHPHTITLGKHGNRENLLFNEEFLNERGISFYPIDRGGDITYHGPGQLVGYPIIDLEDYGLGLKSYIFKLEEIIIRLLKLYNIASERLDKATGVWLDTDKPGKTRKIAAIGVKSSHFVTMHGFALNVNTDLSYFSYINPCGFIDKGVTSMEKELGEKLDMKCIKQQVIEIASEIFVENKM